MNRQENLNENYPHWRLTLIFMARTWYKGASQLRSWTKPFQNGWQSSQALLSPPYTSSSLSIRPVGFSKRLVIIYSLSVGWFLVMHIEQTRVWSQEKPEIGIGGLAYIQYPNSGPRLRLKPSIFFPSYLFSPKQVSTLSFISLGVVLRLKKDLRESCINASWSLKFCFKWTASGNKKRLEPNTSDDNFGKSRSMCGSISWVKLFDPMSKIFERRMKSCQWPGAVNHSEEYISWEWRWTQIRNLKHMWISAGWLDR